MRRFISVALCLIMLLALMPSSAFAEGTNAVAEIIEECPIESVAVERLYVTDQSIEERVEYDYSVSPVRVKSVYFAYSFATPCFDLILKDGTVLKYSSVRENGGHRESGYLYNGGYYYIEYTDPQSVDNIWRVGDVNTIEASVMGYNFTFEVEVCEIKSAVTDDITLIKGVHNQIGGYYNYDLKNTVVEMTNGVKFAGEGNIVYHGLSMLFIHEDGMAERWEDVGDYEKPLTIGSFEFKLPIHVIDNPFKSISVEDMTLMEDAYGVLYEAIFNPETGKYEKGEKAEHLKITVTLGDGSEITGTDFITYEGVKINYLVVGYNFKRPFYFYHLGPGKHRLTIALDLIDLETELELNVVESEYSEVPFIYQSGSLELEDGTRLKVKVNDVGSSIYPNLDEVLREKGIIYYTAYDLSADKDGEPADLNGVEMSFKHPFYISPEDVDEDGVDYAAMYYYSEQGGFERITGVIDREANMITVKLDKTGTYIIVRLPNPCFDQLDQRPKYKLGDVNGDGEISAVDYIMVKRAVIGTYTLDETQFLSADVNRDGDIGAVDYIMVKRHVIGTYRISD